MGRQIAARTYRDWNTRAPAARTISDAAVSDAIREVCWARGADGVARLTPEGLYGRRKLTAYLRRTSMPGVAQCTVVRAMKTLRHQGIRRVKNHQTMIPAKDGISVTCLTGIGPRAPNRKWVTDFTYCRTWAGFVYGPVAAGRTAAM